MILCAAVTGFAQSDTTGNQNNEPDTIKVGSMLIIRKNGGGREIIRNRKNDETTQEHHRKYYKPSNVSTNWWIVDLGFSNFNDNTNYSDASVQAFAPGSTEETFKLRNWKSRNIDLWFFMQRLNIVEHVVNLKYGLGLELNNYFFDDKTVHFNKILNPARVTFDYPTDLHKNKLAADYITAPLMLNINFTPHRGKGFGISAGVSGGYLYSSRQKIKDDGHKSKSHDDFDLRKWKVSYIGEILLGPVKLYGSYATKSMWEKGLDQTPYTVGLRISSL
jgi:hypothetical protein